MPRTPMTCHDLLDEVRQSPAKRARLAAILIAAAPLIALAILLVLAALAVLVLVLITAVRQVIA